MPAPLIPALLAALRGSAAKIGVKGATAKLAGNTAMLKTSSYATGVLTESVLKLNNSFKSFLKINERLSVVNSNFRKEYAKNSSALHGAEQGFGLAAKAMTEFRVLGFKNTNKGMIDLATRMKITGQNSTKMMKTFQDLHGKGGVSEQGLGKLGKSITQSSLKYNTTTDSLIGAIGKLSENLLTLNFAGGTEASTKAVTQLAALVGPAQADMAGELVRLATSTSIQDIDRLARMGLEDWGNKLLTGMHISDSENIRALEKIESHSRNMLGNRGEGSLRRENALGPLVGQLGKIGTILSESARKHKSSSDSVVGVIDSVKETYEHLKATFLAPFQIAMAEMAPSFKRFAEGMLKMGGSMLNFIGAFSPVIIMLLDIITVGMEAIAAGFQTFAVFISDLLGDFSPFGGKKKEANEKSLLQVFQDSMATYKNSIVESNTIASNSFALTSQHYIASTHRSNSILSNMDGSLDKMAKLQEASNSEQVRQNLIDLKTSNSDIDTRLLAIADYSARETAAGHAHFLEMLVKGQRAGNGLLENIENKPIPAAPINPPGE